MKSPPTWVGGGEVDKYINSGKGAAEEKGSYVRGLR